MLIKNICRFLLSISTQKTLKQIVEGYVYLFYENHGRSKQDLKYVQYLIQFKLNYLILVVLTW